MDVAIIGEGPRQKSRERAREVLEAAQQRLRSNPDSVQDRKAAALAYLTLEVMRFYHGEVLRGAVSDPEQYTFSAVWLAFGVVLLLVGLLIGSKPARLASAAVVLLTIAKVFLVDMAGLAGIWRALSFIGLGLVLVGIGYLYQRLLFPRRPAIVAPAPQPGGST